MAATHCPHLLKICKRHNPSATLSQVNFLARSPPNNRRRFLRPTQKRTMPRVQRHRRKPLIRTQRLLHRKRNRVILLTVNARRGNVSPRFVRLLREKRAERLLVQLLYVLLRYIGGEVVVEDVCGVLGDDVSVVLVRISNRGKEQGMETGKAEDAPRFAPTAQDPNFPSTRRTDSSRR